MQILLKRYKIFNQFIALQTKPEKKIIIGFFVDWPQRLVKFSGEVNVNVIKRLNWRFSEEL